MYAHLWPRGADSDILPQHFPPKPMNPTCLCVVISSTLKLSKYRENLPCQPVQKHIVDQLEFISIQLYSSKLSEEYSDYF